MGAMRLSLTLFERLRISPKCLGERGATPPLELSGLGINA